MNGWWVASFIVLWVVVIVLSGVVIALARQIGLLHLRISPTGALDTAEGPPVGEMAPRLAPVLPGRETLVVFGSDGCGLCHDLLPSVNTLARSEPGMVVVVASASAGFVEQVRAPVVPVADVAAVASYRIRSTPYAVYLDSAGIVGAKGIVNTLEHLESVVERGRSLAS